MSRPIILSSPVTHSDWAWRHRDRIGGAQQSTRYMLDRCKENGLTKVYWRCLDGGLALYDSKIVDHITRGFNADNYHAWRSSGDQHYDLSWLTSYYVGADTLKDAVDYGHQIGIEIHAWISINEDDHGWGIMSRFSQEHPQFRWVKRSGMPYTSQLSFAYDQVRAYKLDIVKEILKYDIDGVFFDWMRTGDIRDDPQATLDGTADFGYERPLVEAFEEQFGRNPKELPNHDEAWVRFRAEPQTMFMREVHKLIKGKDQGLPISIMGHSAWAIRNITPRVNGNLYGLLADVETWANEGLIDALMAAGYYGPGGSPEKAYYNSIAEAAGHCDVWLYWNTPKDIVAFEQSIQVAESLGAKQIYYNEADHLDLLEWAGDAAELTDAMAAYTKE